jgi:uncharacterized protein involved in outer membrane biogenesis
MSGRIHIAGPDGFDNNDDFITVNEIQVAVALLPLLSGKPAFREISADKAEIRLTRKKDGSNNWTFTPASVATGADENTIADKSSAGQSSTDMRRPSIDKFQLTNVTVLYNDERRGQDFVIQLVQLTINTENKSQPRVELGGSVQGHPYRFSLVTDGTEILFSGEPWNIHGSGRIAGSQTQLESVLQLTGNTVDGKLGISIENVDLGALLDTMGIVTGQNAVTDNVSLNLKTQGSDLVELYQQAEIKMQFGKGHWKLPSTAENRQKTLLFTSASSFTSWNNPVVIHIDGMLAGEAISLDFTGNRFSEFFDEVNKLDVDLVSDIAGIHFTADGTLDLPLTERQFKLNISLQGNNLEKLNALLDAEFPPFKDFSVNGNLTANNKGFILRSADATIGDTHLQGSIVVETHRFKPYWTINLQSRQIQLTDFAFNAWRPKQPERDKDKAITRGNMVKPYLVPLQRLEKTVRNPKMHLMLKLQADKVLSGKEQLGRGQFQMQLSDDAFSLQNADIELPGGRIRTSLALYIEDNAAHGHLQLDIDKLDYGITTRLFNADSHVDGMISTRIDLELDGANFTRLLDNATGQLDVALWPENTRPVNILNLWATNLYLILLPELKKKESRVNCLVALTDLENGVMKEEFFAIDTTKLWIYGNIDVEFRQEKLELSLFPQSKTARFFSLQSPIRAYGMFDDIHLEINPLDLAYAYLAFITSPLHVPARWIFGDEPLEDGSAVCEQYFDRDYVRQQKMELEKQEQEEINKMLESD